MNRKEFDTAFGTMCKALGVKANKYQGELYWEEFKGKNGKDFMAGCVYCSRGTPGKLPFQSTFADSITAAMEMRIIGEKDKESKAPMSGRFDFTAEERLIANRCAYEASRQARTQEGFDPLKVRIAGKDPSKDEEIRSNYGNETPSPAKIFGSSFLKSPT